MGSAASVYKHPIHPMIIPFPIALWIFSLVCDVIFKMGWGGAAWSDLALYTMIGGFCGAVIAAVPGYIDYRSITSDPESSRIALWHMVVNLSIVVIFGVNIWLRVGALATDDLPFALSLLGVGMLGVSGWLGGELVYVRGLAVEKQSPPGKASNGKSDAKSRAS
jgi:uncharacterized membrane protein